MSKYKGMTTLDRLAAAGKLADFEAAIKLGARETARKILLSVELTEQQANFIIQGAMHIRNDHDPGGNALR